MAKLKVSSSASGTGTVTLIAPATSTDRTITLPDESITLGGGVDGIVSTADATAITIDSSERVMIYPVTSATSAGYLQTGSKSSYYGWVDRAQNATGSNAAFFNQSGSIVGSIASTDTETKFVGVNTAKAWVNFNGNVAAASMIRDSHNVSSITDNGTGKYTTNFSNSLGGSNYSVSGICENYYSHPRPYISTYASGSFQTQIKRDDNSKDDDANINLTVFGD